jgi:glycosyltransferase involved in cell wall biosynthesis
MREAWSLYPDCRLVVTGSQPGAAANVVSELEIEAHIQDGRVTLPSGGPVVSTPVGQIGRVVRDGETAFTSPAGDVAAYGARILDGLDDAASARAVRRAGKRIAEEKFDYRPQRPQLRAFLEHIATRYVRYNGDAPTHQAAQSWEEFDERQDSVLRLPLRSRCRLRRPRGGRGQRHDSSRAEGALPVRVLLLVDGLANGGKERQMALLATALPAEWQRHVWAFGEGSFEGYLRARGISLEVHARRSLFDPVPAAALWRSILTWRPDVVHSWNWMSTLIAGPLCRLMGVPLIDGAIRTGSLRPRHLRLKRIGMACATTVVGNTAAGVQAWGVSPAKARVVYNGFDWSRLAAASTPAGSGSASAASPQNPFVVVMVGRMVPEKDYSVVIAAARLLQKEKPPCRFLLVGNGPQRVQIVAEASDLVAEDIVTFPEADMEVLSYVRRAQVGVLMTNPRMAQEGCSNAIMEYMACGLPVVCGEGGGNREVVVDGKSGFVIPPANPDALAQRIAYLREHEAERLAMGEAGRQRIVETFSLERMVGDFVRIYEEALSS